jgi:hypothetical protein
MDINEQILSHEMTVNWDHQSLANTLNTWLDRFNRHFFENELPTLFLRFEAERTSLAVEYRPGHTAVPDRGSDVGNIRRESKRLSGAKLWPGRRTGALCLVVRETEEFPFSCRRGGHTEFWTLWGDQSVMG